VGAPQMGAAAVPRVDQRVLEEGQERLGGGARAAEVGHLPQEPAWRGER
jgi:hypothetical protein